jgi:excisionase family DNA binding protein
MAKRIGNQTDDFYNIQEKLLRGDDIAQILNVSRSKVYMLIQSGEIASVHIGAAVRVRPSDLQKFISDRVSGVTGKDQ